MKNITPLQWIGIVLIINGALTGSVNELTDLFGAVWAKHVFSVCVIGSGICGGLVTMFGGQGAAIKSAAATPGGQDAMVKLVSAMPGVEPIKINANANQTLAQIAISNAPDAANVEALPAAEAKVIATAKGA